MEHHHLVKEEKLMRTPGADQRDLSARSINSTGSYVYAGNDSVEFVGDFRWTTKGSE